MPTDNHISSVLTFTVADMTCGHCVRTITSAVEGAFPGAAVTADTQTGRVTVSGAHDAQKVAAVIAAEGYTAVPVS